MCYSISKRGLTDLIFVDAGVKSTAAINVPVTAAVARDAQPVRRFLHLSTTKRTCTPGTDRCVLS